jgi:hypothetical protein
VRLKKRARRKDVFEFLGTMLEGVVDNVFAFSDTMMVSSTFGRVHWLPNIALKSFVTDNRLAFGVEVSRDRILRGTLSRKRRKRRHLGRWMSLKMLRLGRLGLGFATMRIDGGWKNRFERVRINAGVLRKGIGMSVKTGIVKSGINTRFRKIGDADRWVLLGTISARTGMVNIRKSNGEVGTRGGRSYHNRNWVTEFLRLSFVVQRGEKVRMVESHLHGTRAYGGRLIRSNDVRGGVKKHGSSGSKPK